LLAAILSATDEKIHHWPGISISKACSKYWVLLKKKNFIRYTGHHALQYLVQLYLNKTVIKKQLSSHQLFMVFQNMQAIFGVIIILINMV
jgi:hypothetical protein